jgi:hypothetical protein
MLHRIAIPPNGELLLSSLLVAILTLLLAVFRLSVASEAVMVSFFNCRTEACTSLNTVVSVTRSFASDPF